MKTGATRALRTGMASIGHPFSIVSKKETPDLPRRISRSGPTDHETSPPHVHGVITVKRLQWPHGGESQGFSRPQHVAPRPQRVVPRLLPPESAPGNCPPLWITPEPPLTRRVTGPPHSGHSLRGSSVMLCLNSKSLPVDSHRYSYVGISSILLVDQFEPFSLNSGGILSPPSSPSPHLRQRILYEATRMPQGSPRMPPQGVTLDLFQSNPFHLTELSSKPSFQGLMGESPAMGPGFIAS